MTNKKFWSQFKLLYKEEKKNKIALENLILSQLQRSGLAFFKDSESVLGLFESTLPYYFELCESNLKDLNNNLLINLMLTYVHSNDLKNAKRIRQILKEKGIDEERPNWLDGVDDFQPSDKFYSGKHIVVKYDRRIEDLSKYFIKGIKKVENFVEKEWKEELPQKMYFNFIDDVGSSPFNILLYEVFLKVSHYYKLHFIREYVHGIIVHEITHFIQHYYIKKGCINLKEDISPYKFIDEGYAEWKRIEYLKKHNEYEIYTNNCAYHVLKSNLFTLNSLKDEWFKVMFDFFTFPTYQIATSFIYFLVKKYGYNRVNNLFISIPKYPNITKWTRYFLEYFGKELIDLMLEWKQYILENPIRSHNKIITHFIIKEKKKNEILFHYKSKYPLWAGNHIFIYDENMKLQTIDKVKKYRFVKEGYLRMNKTSSCSFTIFVHFFQFSQMFTLKY